MVKNAIVLFLPNAENNCTPNNLPYITLPFSPTKIRVYQEMSTQRPSYQEISSDSTHSICWWQLHMIQRWLIVSLQLLQNGHLKSASSMMLRFLRLSFDGNLSLRALHRQNATLLGIFSCHNSSKIQESSSAARKREVYAEFEV